MKTNLLPQVLKTTFAPLSHPVYFDFQQSVFRPITTFLSCLLIGLYTISSVQAQTAAEIVALHLNAKGGVSLDHFRTATFVLEMYNPDQKLKVPSVIYREGKKSIRMDTEASVLGIDIKTKFCYAEKGAWIATNQKVDILPLTDRDHTLHLYELVGMGAIFGIFHEYQEKGYRISLLNVDTFQGREYYKIQTTMPADTITCVSFIDKSSLLEVKRIIIPPSGPSMSVIFKDYRKVGDIMIPFYTKTKNNTGTTIYTYSAVTINTPLEKDIFEVPTIKVQVEKVAAAPISISDGQPFIQLSYRMSVGGDISKRKLKSRPRPTTSSDAKGRVHFSVWIDAEGNVTQKVLETKATTLKDAELLAEFEKNLQHLKFEALPNGPKLQSGYVAFVVGGER
jgi:hypothetical protein